MIPGGASEDPPQRIPLRGRIPQIQEISFWCGSLRVSKVKVPYVELVYGKEATRGDGLRVCMHVHGRCRLQ